MGIAVRARQPGLPYPYDVTFKLGTRKWNAMLVANPFDVEALKLNGLQGVVPTSYNGSSLDPTIEGVRIFRHWVEGLGELRRQADDSHLYYIADGVDVSCGGVAILGPKSDTVTPSGAGSPASDPITLIHEWPGADPLNPVPQLFAICGQQILVCNGDPSDGADWSVSKDFGSSLAAPTGVAVVPVGLATPVISSVVSTGIDSGRTWGYKVVARDVGGTIISSASAEVITVHGANNIQTGVDYNTITWGAVAGAFDYQVFLTTGAGTINGPAATLGLLNTVLDPTVTYVHDTDNGSGSIPPPAAGSTTWEYEVVAQGAFDPPHSAPSAAVSTALGAATLSGSAYNTISWSAVAGATLYQVWRTVAGGTPSDIGLMGTTSSLTMDDSGGAVTLVGELPPSDANGQTPTDLHSFYYGDTFLLLAGMDFGNFWYTTDGVTWTAHDLTGAYFAHTVGNSVPLYRAAQLSLVPGIVETPFVIWKSILDPTSNAGWTAFSSVDPSHAVTRLLAAHNEVLVFTKNAMFLLDSAEITPTPVNSDPENGRVASIFAGDAYTPFGEEWYKITVTSASSATVEPIGLGRFVENRSEIQGTVVASAGHNSWFNYFAVYNGTDTYLMKYGSWLNPGETNTKRWEFASHMHGAITKWEGRRAHSMLVSRILDVGTVGNPRLLVGMDNGTFEIITLPLYVPSPLGDSSCLFVTEGSFTLGIDDGGFGANDKSYHRAALLGANLSDAHGARVSYALDGDETFVDFEQDFTVNGGSVTFPESAQGKLIQPKITLFSDGDTETPQVNSLLLFAQVREFTDADGNPAFRRRRKLVLSTEDWTVNRQGLSDQLLNAQRLRDGIQQIAAAPSATIILSDGKSREISVLAWTEGLVIGPGGQERYGITLEYLESALASGADAGGPPDPGWGP